MADIFTDGFDKYGPVGVYGTALAASMTASEWNTATVTNNAPPSSSSGGAIGIVAPLAGSGLGYALQFAGGGNGSQQASATKTLPGNYATLIGGVRFSCSLVANPAQIQFADGSTAQVTITINASTGTISLHEGAYTGTVLATSTASVAANAIHYLEWEITFGTSASYQIWLDGTSIISGTGVTRQSSDNYANTFTIGIPSLTNTTSGTTLNVDDLYLFDNTTSVNNAPLLTNPTIESQFPVSDSAVAFTPGAGVLGAAYYTTTATNAPGANELFLRRFIAPTSCTLNSVSCLPQATSSTANFKAVCYADSSGAVGSLLSSGTQVTGCTAGTVLTGALTTPETLTGGTAYWIGFITDTSVVLQEVDATTPGSKLANTYTTGAPSTPTGFTSGQPSWLIYGNLTGMANNYAEEDVNPGLGNLSYVSSSTAGTTDLYGFPNLSSTPAAIYTVCVKALVMKTDAGTRTVSLQMKSSSATSAGSNAGQIPLTTYGYVDSFFDVDPNTSAAWTAAGLNAATSGLEVAS